jgi:putative PIN family toxin of toxin-antitoxin system
MKVLLDTNIWVSGLLWGGNPRTIIHLAEQKQIILYTSLPLLNELQNILTYPKLQRRLKKLEKTSDYLLSEIGRLTQICQPISLTYIPELRDPKDKIILETALAIPASAIISEDLDLLVLGVFQKIPIMTASNFLDFYQKI